MIDAQRRVANRCHAIVDAEAMLEPHMADAWHKGIEKLWLALREPLVFRWAGQIGTKASYTLQRAGEVPLRIDTDRIGVQHLFWLLHLEAPLPLGKLGQSANAARNAIRGRAADLFDRAGADELARACLFTSVTDGHLLYEPPLNAPRIEATLF